MSAAEHSYPPDWDADLILIFKQLGASDVNDAILNRSDVLASCALQLLDILLRPSTVDPNTAWAAARLLHGQQFGADVLDRVLREFDVDRSGQDFAAVRVRRHFLGQLLQHQRGLELRHRLHALRLVERGLRFDDVCELIPVGARKTGHPSACEVLLRCLRDGAVANAVFAAQELGKLSCADSRAGLQEAVDVGRDPNVKRASTRALKSRARRDRTVG